MKKFIRSLPGKILVYVALLLSAAILVLSVTGICMMIDGGRIYTCSESVFQREILTDTVGNLSYGIATSAAFGGVINDTENFDYIVKDAGGRIIRKSPDADENTKWQYELKYYKMEGDALVLAKYFEDMPGIKNESTEINFFVSVKDNSPLAENINIGKTILHIAYTLRFAIYAIALAALILTFLLFTVLMCVSGRKPGDDEIHPGLFNKVPFDIILAAVFFAAGIGIAVMFDFGAPECYFGGVVLAILIFAFPGLCMSFAARVKEHSLIKNTFIFRLFSLIWKGIKKICSFIKPLVKGLPLIWKTVLAIVILLIIEGIPLFVMASNWGSGESLIVWGIMNIPVVLFLLYVGLVLRKLQAGSKALADGDLSYVVNTDKMILDFKEHGKNLNNIAGGMAIAVEDRLKSERMKTELITNVSHDIKTPVTSIINYSSLINEAADNEKVREYSEVLVRQSEKLKKLLEDLVEVSKASTGNLEVNLAQCDASVFINQVSGEYESKLSGAGLSLVVKEAEEEIRILADGRRMWRVFDNLMNNICKYALTGTRVYLTLEKEGNDAVFTFKNTSKEPLDISEEELMERFTRGDSSRNTEGNGLGLSIVKTMTELQGGRMELTTDGDLFKVKLTFPVI